MHMLLFFDAKPTTGVRGQRALFSGHLTKTLVSIQVPFIKLQDVLWTDDMKMSSAYLLWIWHRKMEVYAEKYLIPTIKYGGGYLMFWGYSASTDHGARVKVNGIMNFTKHQDILAKNLVASARRLTLGRKWIFQQDN